MLAYKRLYFEYYPSLKEGHFLGEIIKIDGDTTFYELKLPTDSMFAKVHGTIKLHYIVRDSDKTVVLENFTPLEILTEGHQSELVTYKGVMVSKEHSDKDMFKINLLNMLQK